MSAQPTISVIMTVYNHENYVEQAVRSVMKQTYSEWELILLDDGSTDRSAELIHALAREDKRIRAFQQANTGTAAARNRAIARARGNWIAYLDSDDIWYPHALSSYADYFRSHRDAQFVFGCVDRLENQQITKANERTVKRFQGPIDLYQRIFLSTLAVCHRRDLWERVGPFDRSLRWCEDYELFLRMSLHCPLEPIGIATGLRRRHGANVSRQTGRSQQAEAEMLHRFAQRNPEIIDDALASRRVGQLYARAARCYFSEGNYAQAIAMGRLAQEFAPSFRTRMICWWSSWQLQRSPAMVHST